MTFDEGVSIIFIGGLFLILMCICGLVVYKSNILDACVGGDMTVCRTLSNGELARALRNKKYQERSTARRKSLLHQLSD
jgi:hypothetical protein